MNDDKIKVTNFNSQALNALFSVVTDEEFKKISSIESGKEAWTIRMDDDEKFDKFNAKLKDSEFCLQLR